MASKKERFLNENRSFYDLSRNVYNCAALVGAGIDDFIIIGKGVPLRFTGIKSMILGYGLLRPFHKRTPFRQRPTVLQTRIVFLGIGLLPLKN